jgi:hypothetical protein
MEQLLGHRTAWKLTVTQDWAWQYMHVIPATKEIIGRNEVWGQPNQKVNETPNLSQACDTYL